MLYENSAMILSFLNLRELLLHYQFLRINVGTQLDPNLVPIFLKVIETNIVTTQATSLLVGVS